MATLQTRPDGEEWLEWNDENDKLTGDPKYKYYHISDFKIFKDTYIHLHKLPESQQEYFSIFLKEDMVDKSSVDIKQWSVKVPMTPAEIREEKVIPKGNRK